MPPLIENPADCEVRAVIRFLSAKGSKAAEIHRQISEVYGESVMSEGMVRKWVRAFSNGRTNIHDEERSGRPSVIIDDLIEKVDCRVKENRRFTISSLSKEFPAVSRSVLYEIVTGRLNYRKLCSRWVPKMLTEEHKTKRLASALTFLERYSDEGDDFLSRIVTGDETWVAYVTPESKQQSMEWRHSSSPRKVKFKQTISAQKIMCTVFWDRYGVLLVDFLPHRETINSAAYCETLKKLRRAIQNKRRGLLSKGVVLLHDNARPHTANQTQDLITSFGWEQLDHPPYSPDLAPSDYHLFLHLKKHLAGQRHNNHDEVKTTVLHWLSHQAATFFEDGIQKLVPRYDKCLNINGNYVEK
ncbi:histone-lysine N-methyltransferase SETMAR-like [Centruroides sculpturatus]|uniref:histone-lysine N-methyltransferase SETMAR-like n=1 Tax=Centruroides sculpturatus TaxID=218467 RepID=UPI000C6CE363|nr:histone-lysine N-methyltransferase SETMAR-like [Centruroides sculpturatus]XP_023231586.1 histone-lysine N-methyltransferase SETMAR-like [Centruroides sculpturatus]XP_023238181.1 histone-lysine N-methyltransferase SETMAR-like [Centruroides sculpturatus]